MEEYEVNLGSCVRHQNVAFGNKWLLVKDAHATWHYIHVRYLNIFDIEVASRILKIKIVLYYQRYITIKQRDCID